RSRHEPARWARRDRDRRRARHRPRHRRALRGRGAAVLLADVAAEAGAAAAAAIRAGGGRAEFVATDVTREADIAAMIAAAVECFGKLDILVNNAGAGRFVPFERLEPAEWDRLLAVNLRAVYLGCRHALAALRQSGGGAIVNLASEDASFVCGVALPVDGGATA